MSNRLYYTILGLIALIGIIGLLKVSYSMNTLAEDASFRESVRIVDKINRRVQFVEERGIKPLAKSTK